MKKNTYNGWSNYETWLVDVWLTNTYGLQQSIMTDMDERIAGNDDIWAVANLASCIENYIDAVVAENISTCGVVSDLLTASLGRVNYGEIAKNWLEL